MKTNLITLGAALLFTLPLSARQLTPAEAINRMQAENGMSSRHRVPASQLTLAYTATEGEQSLLYVMNRPAESGFVVLSADDCAPAVLGYTDNGSFDGEKVPDSFKWWMSLCEQDIAQAITANKSIQRVSSSVVVEPLIKTTWNQDSPYNNLCTDGFQSVTGCVATAMAQLMKYHEWPNQGKGSHTYSYRVNTGSSIITVSPSVDFSQHTYQWNNMLNDYSGTYSSSQAKAVATLMHDCGVSVDMRYLGSESSAGSELVPSALYQYFDYDAGMSVHYRSNYSDTQWETMILDELKAGRPILYSGQKSANEGHAFICDGHNAEGLYHMNWGWGGYCDGFFQITGSGALNPDGVGIGGGSVGDKGFSDEQEITIGIQPNTHRLSAPPAVMDCEWYDFGNNPVQYVDSNGNFDHLAVTHVSNTSRTQQLYFTGSMLNHGISEVNIAYGIKFTDGVNTYYYQFSNDVFPVNYGPSYFTFNCSEVLKNGTYQVYPAYMDLNAEVPVWKEMNLPPGYEIKTITITGEEADLCLDGLTYFTADGVRTKDNQIQSSNFVLHFKLKALNAVSANRNIVCWVYPEGLGNSHGYFDIYLPAMSAGEVREFNIDASEYYGNSLVAGNKYVVIIDDYDKNLTLASSAYNQILFTVCSKVTPTLDDIEYLRKGLLRDGFGFSISNITDVINIIKK